MRNTRIQVISSHRSELKFARALFSASASYNFYSAHIAGASDFLLNTMDNFTLSLPISSYSILSAIYYYYTASKNLVTKKQFLT